MYIGIGETLLFGTNISNLVYNAGTVPAHVERIAHNSNRKNR